MKLFSSPKCHCVFILPYPRLKYSQSSGCPIKGWKAMKILGVFPKRLKMYWLGYLPMLTIQSKLSNETIETSM